MSVFCVISSLIMLLLFFFNGPATTEIYTLSLHDALPICRAHRARSYRDLHHSARARRPSADSPGRAQWWRDRKSTRLNSSHITISYAVFCLKKKKKQITKHTKTNNTQQPIYYHLTYPYHI